MWRRQTWLRLALVVGVLSALGTAVVAQAQTVSQGYGVTGTVQKGMIVMLDPKDSRKVAPLTNKRDKSMHGVVVSANDTVVSLGGDSSTSQVYVASNGKYDALVSTQNGPIKVGDIISISALDGIGMKADTAQAVILGKALTGFDGTKNVNGTAKLKTSGGEKPVSIGFIQIDIGISRNPLAVSVSGPPVPAFLRKSGDSIAGKPVSTVRLYVSMAVLLITIFMSGSLLYGGVRSSIVSIGRNPLAKKSILRGLIQVVVMGLMVFVIGLVAIYLLLKL
jgi:co-chaperonin GroES (HSP10)